MKNLKVLGGVAAVLVALALCVPAVAANSVTVGDFVMELAKVRGFTASNAAQAKASIESTGITVPVSDFGRTLTQGENRASRLENRSVPGKPSIGGVFWIRERPSHRPGSVLFRGHACCFLATPRAAGIDCGTAPNRIPAWR